MKMPSPSRRTILLGGAGLTVVGAGVGGLAAAATLEHYLEGLVRHTFRRERIDPEGVDLFVSEFIAHADPGTISKSTLLARAAGVVGVAGVDAALSGYGGYAEFKRRLVTQFLLNSDYFYRSDASEPVHCLEWTGVCVNPFARFNDD
ncbi:MAG: hypothetical protein JNM47_16670 [Hyphomonadaceae bacterium]|nr:hypothetical protein [Hyphomonadaceae bacterium]